MAFVLHQGAARTVAEVLPYEVIGAPNMTEVLYRAQERGYRNTAEILYSTLLGAALGVERFTEDDCARAAELVATSRSAQRKDDDATLSLGDGLCLAVADRAGAARHRGDLHWSTQDLKTQFFPLRMR